MPYIKKEQRQKINPALCVLVETMIEKLGPSITKGDMNYVFYVLSLQYLCIKGMNYQNISDVIGALRDSADEFSRRILIPYEDNKIKENGDIVIPKNRKVINYE